MSIAQNIIETIKNNDMVAFSLYAGYGVNQKRNYIPFPIGAEIMELKDKNGRVTKSQYVYADGSKLQYTYNPSSKEYNLKVLTTQ